MDKLFKRFSLLALLLILFLGFYLRSINLNVWPRHGATFDEYAWTWQGINLIQKGVPISWSPHPQYKNADSIIYQETHFRIVKPFLEHPPLFGLVAGSYALLNGVDDMYDLDIEKIRGLALILGLFSILFLYLLVNSLYDKKTALLASLLYATIPTIVVGSRIVQNENFFIPVWVISLYLLHKYLKTNRTVFRNFSSILASLLILAKIPWIAAPLSIILILLFLKKYSDAVKVISIVFIIGIIYLAYGFYYDKELFFNLWSLQLNRYDLVFNSIYALFQKPFLVDRFYTDGWIYFGWISMVLLFLKDFKKNYLLVIPFLSYFLIFLAGIPDEAGHGWYRYPFYPFLVISIVLFLKEYFAKNWALTFVFMVFVGTTLLQLTWATFFGFSYLIFRLSIISWMVSLIPIFIKAQKVEKLAKLTSLSWLSIFILLNIWAVFLYNEQ